MSFLSEINKRKTNLKATETVVTNIDGFRHIEGSNETVQRRMYGFVVDTKPDDVPALVVDHIFIGSQDCATAEILHKYNIKRVLSLGIEVFVPNIHNKFIKVLDLPETNVCCVLKDCLPFIRVAVEVKENVLIHCNAGISRTATVIIGYLMHYHLMQYHDAYEFVKVKRPAIQLNSGFKKQLQGMTPGEII